MAARIKHTSVVVITSATDDVIVVVCLSVCLSVSNFAQTSERICVIAQWAIENKRLNFGGDPDHGSGYESGYGSGSGKTCLGGGMHCPSASSLHCTPVCYVVHSSNLLKSRCMTSGSHKSLLLFPVFSCSFECHIISFHQVAQQVHSFPTLCIAFPLILH